MYLPPGLREVRIFMVGTSLFAMKYFSRMYLPLALEVYNKLFISTLGFTAVIKSRNTWWGSLSQIYSHWPLFLPSPFGLKQSEGCGEYI